MKNEETKEYSLVAEYSELDACFYVSMDNINNETEKTLTLLEILTDIENIIKEDDKYNDVHEMLINYIDLNNLIVRKDYERGSENGYISTIVLPKMGRRVFVKWADITDWVDGFLYQGNKKIKGLNILRIALEG